MVALDTFADVLPDLKQYISSIRRGGIALHTEQTSQLAELLGSFLESDSAKQSTVGALSAAVCELGEIIGSGSSSTAAWSARNVCKRVQALLLEEAAKASPSAAGSAQGVTLAAVESRIAAAVESSTTGQGQGQGQGLEMAFTGQVREAVLEGLAELQGETEMQTILEGMGPSLKDAFRPGDAVLVVLGCAGLPPTTSSPTPTPSAHSTMASTEVLAGVLEAAAEPEVKRPFEVFVQEGGPGYLGRSLALRLASPPSATAAGAGAAAEAPARKAIQTVLVADASIVPILPRVTKVIVPAFAISSGGDAVVPAGAVPVVLAARGAGKPVIVVATSLHLCPEATGAELGLPASLTAVGSQSTGQVLRPSSSDSIDDSALLAGVAVAVAAPVREVLPSSLITAYLLDTGLTTAAGVKQLVKENYGHAQ